jgi:hypothetical protein
MEANIYIHTYNTNITRTISLLINIYVIGEDIQTHTTIENHARNVPFNPDHHNQHQFLHLPISHLAQMGMQLELSNN